MNSGKHAELTLSEGLTRWLRHSLNRICSVSATKGALVAHSKVLIALSRVVWLLQHLEAGYDCSMTQS